MLSERKSRGLRYAGFRADRRHRRLCLLTVPSGAPLRNPDTGELIGNSPFMNGLIALIMLVVSGDAAGPTASARERCGPSEVIKAMEKTVTGLAARSPVLRLSQFVAYFTYTNMGTVMALSLSGVLQAANIGPLAAARLYPCCGDIDLLLTGAIAKWAIFAPVFVPLLMKLGVEPEAVLAAYRVGNSPMNAITPMNAYFALIVGFVQKYDRNAGVGTVVSLMLPYVIWMFVLWTVLFALWQGSAFPGGCDGAAPPRVRKVSDEFHFGMMDEHNEHQFSSRRCRGRRRAPDAVFEGGGRDRPGSGNRRGGHRALKKPACRPRRSASTTPISKSVPTETGNLIVDLPAPGRDRACCSPRTSTRCRYARARSRSARADRIVSDGTTALGGDTHRLRPCWCRWPRR